MLKGLISIFSKTTTLVRSIKVLVYPPDYRTIFRCLYILTNNDLYMSTNKKLLFLDNIFYDGYNGVIIYKDLIKNNIM